MQCKCDFENASGARFCGRCGSVIGPESGAAIRSEPVSPSSVPMPKAGGHRSSRFGVAIVVGTLAIAVAGYWWLHRPSDANRRDNNSGLYRITANGKHGFMNRSGETVIAPQFDGARGFSEGLAAVQVGSRFGFINAKGEMAITPQFDEATEFSEGLAAVRVGTKFGYINKDGLVIITPQFDGATRFQHGRAAVRLCCGPVWSIDTTAQKSREEMKYGFIDTKGKFIGTPDFQFVQQVDLLGPDSGWSDDSTLVIDGQYRAGILSKSGQIKIIEAVEEVGVRGFKDGLGAASSRGKWGFLNVEGKWAIEPQFEVTYGFHDGLAPVRVGGRWGIIDSKGRFIVNPQFDGVGWFAEDRAAFAINSQYGFLDKTGRVVIAAQYAQAASFSEGLAGVKNGEGWGFIDRMGKVAIAPQFDSVSDFHDGLALVTLLGKEGYIDRTGTFVVNPFPGATIAAMRKLRDGLTGRWRKRATEGGQMLADLLTISRGEDGVITVEEKDGGFNQNSVFGDIKFESTGIRGTYTFAVDEEHTLKFQIQAPSVDTIVYTDERGQETFVREASLFIGKWSGYQTSYQQLVDSAGKVTYNPVLEEVPSFVYLIAHGDGKFVVTWSSDVSPDKQVWAGHEDNGKIVADGEAKDFYKLSPPTLEALRDGTLKYSDGANELILRRIR